MAPSPERADYVQPVLVERLRYAIARINPQIPLVAREDAIKQVLDLGIPALLTANRHFHNLLVNGVPVQYQKDGETRGDFVYLIDWENRQGLNEFLAVNQYTLKGPKYSRRPDIILFINGLPLVLLEAEKPSRCERVISGKPTTKFRPIKSKFLTCSSTTKSW